MVIRYTICGVNGRRAAWFGRIGLLRSPSIMADPDGHETMHVSEKKLKQHGPTALRRFAIGLLIVGCGQKNGGSGDQPEATIVSEEPISHGKIATGIYGRLGEPLPSLSEDNLATFARGKSIALRRFKKSEGLGPAFNITFCIGCHEKPVAGGSAGLYRNFIIAGNIDGDKFVPSPSHGPAAGIQRRYAYDERGLTHVPVAQKTSVIARRNPIPFFGMGLISELTREEVLKNADEHDEDGDGISGRPNFDQGFLGKFGRKAQAESIDGFVRGPMFNHAGLTTNFLTDEQLENLPIDLSRRTRIRRALLDFKLSLGKVAQATVELEKNFTDDDEVVDPEISADELFDLVAFTMLLAAPEPDKTLSESATRGLAQFNAARCHACHTPRINGPRGPLPIYSDLLLHDMGEALADGLIMNRATGREFRTQPLWGVIATAPYLHDGRAGTIDEAIRYHGGEAQTSRDYYVAMSSTEKSDLLEFLASLGGRDQATPGLLAPNEELPQTGYGAPISGLSETELAEFTEGRREFDREFYASDGAGTPRLNGDSCRACHFEPVIGGAGPSGVNVIRHGIKNTSGEFVEPAVGTILHRTTVTDNSTNYPQQGVNIYELRQTPHLFGIGLIQGIPDSEITSRADPFDKDNDGISGRVSIVDGGRLGRFGWKAQVPTVLEFTRDALSAELGLTMPREDGNTFGSIHDTDDIADPEVGTDLIKKLTRFMELLGPPPRNNQGQADVISQGDALFKQVGCDRCHVPALQGKDGEVALYSDLLLHEIRDGDTSGIEEGSANVQEFRTAPLWGLGQTAPYLHDGSADSITEAIEAHRGEANAVRQAFVNLSDDERSALLTFLRSL